MAQITTGIESSGVNAGPWQRIFIRALSVIFRVTSRGETDVRHHATLLRGAAINTEELSHRDLQLAHTRPIGRRVVIQVQKALHGAFAKGRFTNNQPATIVLDGRSKNFRCRSTVAIYQYRQWSTPDHAGLNILFQRYAATGIAHLHNRALINEKAGKCRCFQQRTAAIVAQVNHDSLYALLFKLRNELAHVSCTGTVIRFVLCPAVEIEVENRQVDHTNFNHFIHGPPLRTLDRQFDDFALGRLFFQLDLITDDVDDAGEATNTYILRQDLETYYRVLGAADQVHHIVDAPANDINHLAFPALADSSDTVTGLQAPVLRSRTARYDS